jgi:plastocyanin
MQKAPGSGDGQSGVAVTTLLQPLRVLVLQDGVPFAGKVVTFTPSGGAGTVFPVRDTTDVDGIASVIWTLGTSAGAGAVQATAPGVTGGPLNFTAVVQPGPPAVLILESGDGQAQATGVSYERPLVVRVVDQFGNSLAGVSVDWDVTAGSGSLSAASSVTAADGRASVGLVAGGSVGPVTVVASLTATPGISTQFALAVVAAVTTVEVASNLFTPADVTVSTAGAVRWSWVSGEHNVAQLDGPVSFNPSPVQTAGASYGPLLFNTPGVYHYECSLHEGMLGTITVVDPSSAPSGE